MKKLTLLLTALMLTTGAAFAHEGKNCKDKKACSEKKEAKSDCSKKGSSCCHKKGTETAKN